MPKKQDKNLTINDLAGMLKRGFVAVDKKIDRKIDGLALMVKHGFDGVDKRFDKLEKENKEEHQQIFNKLESLEKRVVEISLSQTSLLHLPKRQITQLPQEHSRDQHGLAKS